MSLLAELAESLPDLPHKLLIGFSGGCDSTALVCLLLQKKEAEGYELSCVHVNHGLRGEESDGDADFVEAFCRAHDLPLLSYRAQPDDTGSEDWARKVRYDFFRRAMAECGADALVLAHHQDDQAETFLLHLLRGSGLDGLCGMSPQSSEMGIPVCRPLLGISHSSLQKALTEMGQVWREDHTNAESRYMRNRVRHEVLPVLEQLSPGCTGRIAACAALLREDAEAISGRAEALLGPFRTKKEIPLSLFADCPEAVVGRVLRSWWLSHSCLRKEHALSSEHTHAFVSFLQSAPGSVLQLPGQVKAYRGYTHIHLIGACSSKQPEPVQLEDSAVFQETVFHVEACSTFGDGKTGQAFLVSQLPLLQIRTRKPGDYIRPFGQKGKKPLKTYLIDKKVDQPFRDRIPLICQGNEVLVVCGVGAGRVDLESIHGNMYVHWSCADFPWYTEK